MKKMLCFLLFVMSLVSFSQDSEELPRELWEEIVEIKLSDPNALRKWSEDVKVELRGNYTLQDSIKIAEILKKLDVVTETVSLGFSNGESSNLQINFSDFYGSNYIRFNSDYGGKRGFQYIERVGVFIEKTKEVDEVAMNCLKITLAKGLFTGNFIYTHENSGYALFSRPMKNVRNDYVLNENDLKIVEEIYKEGFDEKLILAEKLYTENVLKKISDYKILDRDRELWWVQNPISVLVLPILMFFLIFLFLFIKIKKIIDVKVKDNVLNFTSIAFVILFFVDIIIILSVSCYDFLTTPGGYNLSFIRQDTIITTFFVTIMSFPFLYSFRYLEFKIQKSYKNILTKTIFIFISTGVLPFCIVLLFIFIFKISAPKPFEFNNNVYLTFSYVFLFIMSVASIRALIGFFMFKEHKLIVETETQISHLKELNAQAELKSLQSQINPHFLYNSLNSIASLATVDAIKTQEMAYSLSDLFKYSINRKGKKMSIIQEEIDMVNSYLEIEKIRFGDRLQFNIEVETSVLNYKIPLFLIQPLVENAIKHGVAKNKDQGEITLKIAVKEHQLLITVYDNGPDFPEGLVGGHGLQTVYDLLRLSYQDQAMLNWTNEPQKKIQIMIPQNL